MINRPEGKERAGYNNAVWVRARRSRTVAARLPMVCGGLFLLGAVSAHAADSQAQDILKKMTAAYNVKSFQGTANLTISGDAKGKPFTRNAVQEVTYKSPNLFNIKVTGNAVGGSQTRIFDGKTRVLYASAQNQYIKQDVPPGTAKVTVPPLSLFGVTYDVQTAKMMPATTVAGHPAYVVAATPPLPQLVPNAPEQAKQQLEQYRKSLRPFEMAIDKANYHLLRVTQSSMIAAGAAGASKPTQFTQTLDFTQQTFSPAISDSLFAFTPPKGATERKLPAQGAPGQASGSGKASAPSASPGGSAPHR